MLNPIAVPLLEPAERTMRAQAEAKYASLAEVPPIEYIRPEIPSFTTPRVSGQRDTAMVPDTLDLAERARLAVNHLTEIACPEANGEIYYWPVFVTQVPPRLRLNEGSGQLWPKYMEALPLMRVMSGSEQNAWVDEKWAETLLKSLGPDGLYYLPLAGRPWDPPGAFHSPDRGAFRGAIHMHGGRMLGVLALYYSLTGDEVWLEAGRRMVDGLAGLVDVVDGRGVILMDRTPEELENLQNARVYYYPGDRVTPGTGAREAVDERSSLFNWDTSLYTTWVVTGLSQFYRVSQYEPALELAWALARTLRAQYPEDGSWYGHHHCGTLAVQAFSELAAASGDRDMAQFAKKTYEWARDDASMGAIRSLGYFPVMQPKTRSDREPMEPCSVADMVAIAVKLTQIGVGDYYDDIDAYARNGLAEAQFTHPDQVLELARKVVQGTANGYSWWGLPAGSAGEELPIAYNEIADRFAERVTGMFSMTVWPNDMNPVPGHDLCCMGNCSRALYYAWQEIVRFDEEAGELKVNLLLDRASTWADVRSSLPYAGRVEIVVKRDCRLKVRMNDWIDREQVILRAGDSPIDFAWDGRYVDMGQVETGQTITLEFPIAERTEQVSSFALNYTATFRGSDAVAIEPRHEANNPTYQREHYRTDQPRMVERERFVSDRLVNW